MVDVDYYAQRIRSYWMKGFKNGFLIGLILGNIIMLVMFKWGLK